MNNITHDTAQLAMIAIRSKIKECEIYPNGSTGALLKKEYEAALDDLSTPSRLSEVHLVILGKDRNLWDYEINAYTDPEDARSMAQSLMDRPSDSIEIKTVKIFEES